MFAFDSHMDRALALSLTLPREARYHARQAVIAGIAAKAPDKTYQATELLCALLGGS